jgi:hypothetical protein
MSNSESYATYSWADEAARLVRDIAEDAAIVKQEATDATSQRTIERTRCLGIITGHMIGHRMSLQSDKLSEIDRALHEGAIAALETVAERIAEP